MMKRNAIARTLIASAVLAVVGVAQAGSLTVTKRTVANESFGTAYTATTALYVPNVTYTFNTPGGIVVNPGGSISVKFVMTGGKWSSSAALAAGNAVVANLPAGLTAGTPAITDGTATSDTVVVSLTNSSTTTNVTIGIGATVTLTSVGGATRFQAIGVTQGTAVNVTGGAYNGVNVLEAPTAASTLIDYAQAVTGQFTASTETKKIDLTASPAGSALTAGVAGANKVNLGKVTFKNATTAPVDLDVNAATLAETNIVAGAPAFGGAFTVTVGVASGALNAKQAVQLYSDAACSVALTGGAPTQAPTTGAVTAATTSIVISANGAATAAQTAADLTNGAFVCSDYSGLTAGTVITPVTPTIAASYTKASTTYTGDTLAANNGYALNNNGQTTDVRSYIPVAASGYTSFIRAINTGSISAVVTGQFIYADGTTSASAALGTLAAGGSVTWTSAQIEAAIGTAPAGTARPRLRLTAPTSGLQAQSFILTNANGNFSDATGAQ